MQLSVCVQLQVEAKLLVGVGVAKSIAHTPPQLDMHADFRDASFTKDPLKTSRRENTTPPPHRVSSIVLPFFVLVLFFASKMASSSAAAAAAVASTPDASFPGSLSQEQRAALQWALGRKERDPTKVCCVCFPQQKSVCTWLYVFSLCLACLHVLSRAQECSHVFVFSLACVHSCP